MEVGMHAVGVGLAASVARTPDGTGISFGTVLVVAVIACIAPVLAASRPSLRLPSVVLEIVLGIVVGPALLDLVHVDLPLDVLSLLGLAFLLFLAGLELDPKRLRGGMGRIGAAFVASFLICLVFGFGVALIGETHQPLFVAIALASTSLGLVVPVLHDAGVTDTAFGQLALAAAMVAEFGTILMLSLLFSNSSTTPEAEIALLALFGVSVVVAAFALVRVGHWPWVSATLARLENTSAQLGVRLAMALLVLMAFLASKLGLETILGAFVAGALLRVVDPHERLCHTAFRSKMDAIGYGFLVPTFFVASGIRLDVQSLLDQPHHLVLVPYFLLALLAGRGLPALFYRRLLGPRRALAAGLLQATSLTFIVIAAHLGTQLEVFDDATAAALVLAGLLSVVLFPPLALTVLDADAEAPVVADPPPV
jgi:Kef-type K+ transport system membrane component KefB